MDIDEYERRAEQFEEALGREDYLSGAGLKETLEIGPIYQRFADLFTRDAVDDLRRRQNREGRYLAAFATLNHLEDLVKDLTEATTNQMLCMTVPWDGQEVPYRAAAVVLANEPGAARRHELQRRIMDRTAELNPLLADRQNQLHVAAEALGYPGYTSMCDDLRGLDLVRLTEWMRGLLARTEESYTRRLYEYLARLKLPSEEARTGDLSFLFRAPEFDTLFPAERLVPALRATLAGLGLDLDTQPNLTLDVEPRPLKSPRAFCSPIRVPDEVVLVIFPHGGQDDYRALLHEAGHAEHFVFTSPERPFAYKRLGDNSVSEAYAFLFDNLLQSRSWLSAMLGTEDFAAYHALASFYKCYMLRRYATKLVYEQDLHKGRPGMDERYVALFEANLLVKHWPQNYLADVDDFFYAAQYVRAWIFEMQLRRHLERAWGEGWFQNREAGRLLTGLYGIGQEKSVDELARDLGYSGLDPEPLIEELAR